MDTNDIWQRREMLSPVANPDKTIDYVVTLSGALVLAEPPEVNRSSRFLIWVRYVPDRLVIPPDAFAAYLKSLSAMPQSSQEALATTVLADISNEIVARWVQILTRVDNGSDTNTHQVMIEDRQPGWDNSSLLARIV